jgi:alkanesulfonate monooxygenase SsuD/methylene tetrahydromethanopterin reductase-like flavin-dependent oxidoreductase (luciferase family)
MLFERHCDGLAVRDCGPEPAYQQLQPFCRSVRGRAGLGFGRGSRRGQARLLGLLTVHSWRAAGYVSSLLMCQ